MTDPLMDPVEVVAWAWLKADRNYCVEDYANWAALAAVLPDSAENHRAAARAVLEALRDAGHLTRPTRAGAPTDVAGAALEEAICATPWLIERLEGVGSPGTEVISASLAAWAQAVLSALRAAGYEIRPITSPGEQQG